MNQGHYFVNVNEAKTRLGVCSRTLRNWEEAGKIESVRGPSNKRFYDLSSIKGELGNVKRAAKKRRNVIYCRVSSQKQKADLERQTESLQRKYPGHEVIQDIGSGINWKRRGLRTILRYCMEGSLQTLVVAHRDRLSRLAFELIEFIVKENGGSIVVDSRGQDKTPSEELGEDLLSIVHIFSCREYGKRKYSKRKRDD